ncbi:MAG: hypothetical protein ABIQ36_06490 [Rhodanobacter sp.]
MIAATRLGCSELSSATARSDGSGTPAQASSAASACRTGRSGDDRVRPQKIRDAHVVLAVVGSKAVYRQSAAVAVEIPGRN